MAIRIVSVETARAARRRQPELREGEERLLVHHCVEVAAVSTPSCGCHGGTLLLAVRTTYNGALNQMINIPTLCRPSRLKRFIDAHRIDDSGLRESWKYRARV
eukprot:gene41161-44444_t